MKAKERNAAIEYTILILILFVGLYSLLLLRNYKSMQMFSILIMAFAYVLWGIAHHSKDKTLHYKIVVEYALLSGAVSIILYILLFLAR